MTTIDKLIKWQQEYNKTNFVKKINKIGFKFLGDGVTRKVYGNGTIAIKISKTFSGDNNVEFNTYKQFEQDSVLKYTVIPFNGCYLNLKKRYSILIGAQAKLLKIDNNETTISPAEHKNDENGFRVRNKTFHEIAIIFNKCFKDAHGDNIMKFGKSIVMIDLNNEKYTIIKKKFEKYIRKYKLLSQFKLHKKSWEKLAKKILPLDNE